VRFSVSLLRPIREGGKGGEFFSRFFGKINTAQAINQTRARKPSGPPDCHTSTSTEYRYKITQRWLCSTQINFPLHTCFHRLSFMDDGSYMVHSRITSIRESFKISDLLYHTCSLEYFTLELVFYITSTWKFRQFYDRDLETRERSYQEKGL